jgi:hypothetical protein
MSKHRLLVRKLSLAMAAPDDVARHRTPFAQFAVSLHAALRVEYGDTTFVAEEALAAVLIPHMLLDIAQLEVIDSVRHTHRSEGNSHFGRIFALPRASAHLGVLLAIPVPNKTIPRGMEGVPAVTFDRHTCGCCTG